uniref:RNA-directed DNA polymerase, eukaryota n=1 Tax=Tanacetum cinerariifolium TaxID=118510 RepID=A0A6L2LW93_TANCI|nr:RNA-directed DNA polymerase, eukaryota [Tanacetum cinerariifolium]
MAAPVISISSDSSYESVGSFIPRIIIFGYVPPEIRAVSDIPIEVPIVLADLPIAPEVKTTAVDSLVEENYGLLCSKVGDLVLPNISDRWCWSLEGSQEFSVKSSPILIDNTILPKAEVPTRWLRVVPIK